MKRAVASWRAMMSTMSSPLKLPVSPRNVFDAVVVVVGAVDELRVVVAVRVERDRVLERPAGERPRALLDVGLGVVADPHREQLEDLAAVVLVDRLRVVLVVVQPVDHGRIAREVEQERAEVREAVLAEHLDVADHRRGVLALGPAGGEDVVPEQRHLLFERALRVDHPPDPAPVPRRRVVDVGAQVRVVAGKDVLVQVRHPLGVDQLLDHLFVRPRRVRLKLVARCPESGPPQQMGHQGETIIGHAYLLSHHRFDCT